MKRKAEEPTRHLLISSPPVFEQGKLGEGTSNHNLCFDGWFIVLPLDPLELPGPPRNQGYLIHMSWEHCIKFVGLIKHIMDCAKDVREWEAVKICLGWENAGVSLADIFNRRIYGCEGGKSVEAT